MCALVINENDNVAVALRELKKEEVVELEVKHENIKVRVLERIPLGHKFAIKDIEKGEHVLKYGAKIGRAKKKIRSGEHVHVHNLESLYAR